MKAHTGLDGNFLDHGQSLLEENDERILSFPVYEDKDLLFLDKSTEIGR